MFSFSKTTAGLGLALAIFSMASCTPESIVQTPVDTNSTPRDPAPIARVVCDSCGIVRSVVATSESSGTFGAGVVLGALVGGVAGNQVGGGDGKKLATVAGAIGGAVLGNKIEQDRKGPNYYEVTIDMENGGREIIMIPDATGISAGSEVLVNGNTISLR